MSDGRTQPEALLLVGGLGTRLQPVVSDRPKPMAEVHQRPFVTFLLDQLIAADVRHAVLCTGHLGDRVREILGSHYRGLALTYSTETIPLGTAGALRLAVQHTASSHVLAMNGDSFFGIPLEALLAFQLERPSQPALAARKVADTSRFGHLTLSEDHTVQAFHEKRAGAGSGWINAGIYVMPRAAILAFPEGPLSLERDIFPTWTGMLRAYPGQGPFLDIGTPESYAAADGFFASKGVS